jgi:CheY-like chemotaxis protein
MAAGCTAQTMGERASVLVVEDNDETRAVLERILVWRGYAVESATDGEEALAVLRAGRRPTVIILDLAMPVMDGETFLREMRATPALASIPVVAFTARATRPPHGVAAFVRKGSDDPDVLLNAIAACLTA